MAMTRDQARNLYPDAEMFRFGDGPELSATLLALVRAGTKTATCAALRDYRADNEPVPVAGRRDIALTWEGTPALLIELVEVTVRRFCDVDADFALAEGEETSLAGWQAGHRADFERDGGWTSDMELVCKRFALVEDLG